MQTTQLEALVEDLTKKGIPVEEVTSTYNSYVEHGFPPETSANFARKKLLPQEKGTSGDPVTLTSLQPCENATLEGVIQSKQASQFENGNKEYGNILVFDESLQYGSFQEVLPCGAGQRVRLTNCKVYEYNGALRITVRESTKVEILDEQGFEAKDTKVADIVPNRMPVNIEGRVVSVREFTKDGRTMYFGVLADETGSISFSAFESNPELSAEDVVRLENVTPSTYQGETRIVIDKTTVKTTAEGNLPALDALETHRTIQLDDITEGSNFDLIKSAGIVVAVKDGSGLIRKCGTCSKPLDSGRCAKHGGSIEKVPDLTLKFILDDGLGIANVKAGLEVCEHILKRPLKEVIDACFEAGDNELAGQWLQDTLLGKEVEAFGSASNKPPFGPWLYADKVDFITSDPNQRAAKLFEAASKLHGEVATRYGGTQ